MQPNERKKLEKAGWKVGSVEEFLGLSREESAYIEMKLALSDALKKERAKKRVSQAELARRISSSRSRVAQMEAADPSVSVDLLLKSLLALGVTRNRVGKALAA